MVDRTNQSKTLNKVVLVTGSAIGIGRAIIQELAKNGYNCVINYLNSEKEALSLKEEVETKYGITALAIKADVSNESEVDQMFSTIEQVLGGVDILVNNAGIDLSDLFELQKTVDFKRTLDVNLIGAYLSSKRAESYMYEKKWGRIINISSTNGINTYYPTCIAYDASKAGMISLTHNLSVQFAPYIHVNAIALGFIGTKNELKGYDEEFLKQELDKILLKRYGDPIEVAYLVKFLISEEANFFNNSIIRLDGGQLGS